MNKNVPISVIFIPPLLAALMGGICVGLIAVGITIENQDVIARQTVFISIGSGTTVGFFWGALVWSDKLVNIYNPRIKKIVTQTKEVKPIRIELKTEHNGGLAVKYLDLPSALTIEKMVKVANILVGNGFTFSHALSGKGRPLNRNEFEILRDAMISRGLAKWNNPHARNQGIVLTKEGKNLFAKLTTHPNGSHPETVQTLG